MKDAAVAGSPGERPEFDLEAFVDRHAAAHALGEARQRELRRALTAPPDRVIRPGALNTPAIFPSDKVGLTDPVESAHELARRHLLEADPSVLHVVTQPAIRLRLSFRDRRGRRVTIWTTPDAVVLERRAAVDVLIFEELKAEAILARWTAEGGDRVRFEEGSWRSPAGETAAAAYGGEYRLVSTASIAKVPVRNAILVHDFRGRAILLEPSTVQAIRATVAARPGITLRELSALHRSDDILSLLADGLIYGDLLREPFYHEGSGRLFLNAVVAASRARQVVPVLFGGDGPALLTAEAGRAVRWDGRPLHIALVGEGSVALQADDGRVSVLPAAEFERLVAEGQIVGEADSVADWVAAERERIMARGPAAWDEASRRLELLDRAEAGEAVAAPRRSLVRWRARYRRAERELGWGLLGLLPEPNVGNRTNHGPEERQALIAAAIKDVYESGEQTTIVHVYGEVLARCEQAGLEPPPAYETVRQAVHRGRMAERIRLRLGAKAGAAAAGPVQTTGPLAAHGSFGWAVAHCDHTLLDIELVDTETGINLGRPWLTLIIDAYSRSVLGYALSFGAPSRRAVGRALRDCVRRHRRLPSMLVLDGGSEFRSGMLQTLGASFRIVIRYRAASKPRFGAEIESFLGGFTKSFLHALRGGTKLTKNVRLLTKETEPRRRAVWDLASLAAFFERWLDDVYHPRPHPAHHLPPLTRLAESQRWSGERVLRLVAYSRAFYIATLPEVDDGGTRVVHATNGVKVQEVHYFHPDFGLAEVAGKPVPVRADPDDIRYVHAWVQGRWVTATAAIYEDLGAISVEEREAASAEFDRLVTLTGQARPKTAKALAALLRDARAHEAVLAARRIAALERAVNGGAAEGSEPDLGLDDPAAPEASLPELFDDDDAGTAAVL